MPGLADLIGGRVTVSQIRDVEIKDLLGREQVHLATAKASVLILFANLGRKIGEQCH